VSDPDIFCDTGTCAEDAELKAECEDAFLLCLVDEPDEEECVALALLICEPGCATGADCGAGEICVDTRCVSDPDIFCDTGTCAEDAELKAECEDAFLLCLVDEPDEEECVALALLICEPGCATGADCGAGEICVDGSCVSDPDIFCDTGTCAEDAGLKAECKEAFLLCLAENPDEEECVALALLICAPAGGPCEGEADGTPCECPVCGADGLCISGACEDVVIGAGDEISEWRALPKMCESGTFDATAFLYTCITPVTPTQDVPGGGTANAFSDPMSPYRGCEVPSSALAGQLATDTFMTVISESTGDGKLTVQYQIVAINAALGIAAAIAELVDLNAITDISEANPPVLNTGLLPAFQNTPVGLYVTGGNTFTLDVELDIVEATVVPTSYPTVAVNFSSEFLLELFLTTAMQPLNISSENCFFDNPAPTDGAPMIFNVVPE
jgi:hypothetical protein